MIKLLESYLEMSTKQKLKLNKIATTIYEKKEKFEECRFTTGV